jgi:hypothetical protein
MTSTNFQLQYGVNFNDNAKRTATFAVVAANASGLVASMVKFHTFSVTGKQAKLAAKGEQGLTEWAKANGLNVSDYKVVAIKM